MFLRCSARGHSVLSSLDGVHCTDQQWKSHHRRESAHRTAHTSPLSPYSHSLSRSIAHSPHNVIFCPPSHDASHFSSFLSTTSSPSLCLFAGPSVRSSLLPHTWLDASDNEVLLRRFDLDYAYGPCGGLSRRARWLRAQKLGLSPPQEVWDILSQLGKEEEGEKVVEGDVGGQ